MNKGLHIASDQKVVFCQKISLKGPSFVIEYAYYAVLIYGMFGQALGVLVPLVGAGALAGLAILCLMHFGQTSQGLLGAFKPIMLALVSAILALIIQLVVYEESFGNGDMRSLVTWSLSLIVIQSLSLRKGFLHRFALVAFLIGCGTIPFLKVAVETETFVRMGVEDTVGLGNMNEFGMWFGFCAVYFLVMGLETRNYLVRGASWLAVLLSLYMIAVTVGRGPLLGVAIAVVLVFQKLLKKSFVPLLSLVVGMWLIYLSGMVDTLVGYFVQRGAEETGRSYLWSAGLRIFLDSWWIGVGLADAVITLPISGRQTGPHNGLLWWGMSSGIIPLAFFVGYLMRAARGAFYSRTQKTPYANYKLPLYAFAFLEMMLIGTVFMSPWHMVVFSIAMLGDEVPRMCQSTWRKKRSNAGESPIAIP